MRRSAYVTETKGSPDGTDILAEGRFLRLLRRNNWEYAERRRSVGAVFIAAVTDDRRLVLIIEDRIPVRARVVAFPAGLVGDEARYEGEPPVAAVRRELIEEAGYDAASVEFLTRGPTSAGMIDELIDLVLATGLRRVGPGGGTAEE